jgi:hypothetical protein
MDLRSLFSHHSVIDLTLTLAIFEEVSYVETIWSAGATTRPDYGFGN